MCTLSIVPTQAGYAAAMNRDELRLRPPALPGLAISETDLRFVAPREASGGTWFGCSERGDLFALLNWNLGSRRANSRPFTSRGAIIPQIIAAEDARRFESAIGKLALECLAPFRLVGVFWKKGTMVEVRWDGVGIAMECFPWARAHWFSSSVSDERATLLRGATCERAATRWPAETNWLKRLHRCHGRVRGPFSVCVHRDDAATVSYTEATVDGRGVVMKHLAGNPCKKEEFDSEVFLPLALRGF